MFRISRTRLALTVALPATVVLAALALAAPGSKDDGGFGVTLADGEVRLEAETLPTGRHVIEVVNEGTAEHELVVVRTDLAPDELPVGLHGVSIGQAGELVLGEDHLRANHKHAPGSVLGLLPGELRRHQADLEPGHYVVFCQTGSHYLAGERAAFTVR